MVNLLIWGHSNSFYTTNEITQKSSQLYLLIWNTDLEITWMLKWSRIPISSSFLVETTAPSFKNEQLFINININYFPDVIKKGTLNVHTSERTGATQVTTQVQRRQKHKDVVTAFLYFPELNIWFFLLIYLFIPTSSSFMPFSTCH